MQIKNLLFYLLLFGSLCATNTWAQDVKVNLQKDKVDTESKRPTAPKDTNKTSSDLGSKILQSIQQKKAATITTETAAKPTPTPAEAKRPTDTQATDTATQPKTTKTETTTETKTDSDSVTDSDSDSNDGADTVATADTTGTTPEPSAMDSMSKAVEDVVKTGLKKTKRKITHTINAITANKPVLAPPAPPAEQTKILKFDVQVLRELAPTEAVAVDGKPKKDKEKEEETAAIDSTKQETKEETPKITKLEITALDARGRRNTAVNGTYNFAIDKGDPQSFEFVDGRATSELDAVPQTLFVEHFNGIERLNDFYRVNADYDDPQTSIIPQWMGLIPPLVAIILALLFREVLFSLFIGVFIGVLTLAGFSWENVIPSFFKVIDKYIIGALKNPDHLSVIVFSLLIGGMVAIISRNGGMAGVVKGLSFFARGPRSSQFVTWLMGIAIFFDDYANTLIVGNTMRSITDKYRVSREKLAYIVDSTAAPVAAIALITTWIGAELGYIGDASKTLGINEEPYSIFLNSLQYSFYPVLTLFFILMLILFKRDYGSMWDAEVRARATGKLADMGVRKEEELKDAMEELQPVEGIGHYAFNAILPILTVIGVTMWGLYSTGYDAAVMEDPTLTTFNKLSTIVGNSDSYKALMWSSISGVLMAVFLSVLGRFLSLRGAMESMVMGIKTMMPAIVILVLAWALAQITKDLRTADYLTTLLEGNLDPKLMPTITFLLSGFIAFATGSSWSTMAILYPILLPTTWTICMTAGFPVDVTMPIFYSVTASVLAGSVFGDHCSPISDTTILSSLATGCNHIDHVSTQLHYAITVGIVSVGMGLLAVYTDWPFWSYFAIGASCLLLIVLIAGRTVHDAEYYQPQVAAAGVGAEENTGIAADNADATDKSADTGEIPPSSKVEVFPTILPPPSEEDIKKASEGNDDDEIFDPK